MNLRTARTGKSATPYAHFMTVTAIPSLATQALEAMQASADGILMLSAVHDTRGIVIDYKIISANASASRLLRADTNGLVGRYLQRDMADSIGAWLFERYREIAESGQSLSEELRVDHRAFAASWLAHQAVQITGGLAVTLRDISAHKREARRLKRASLRDDLTGLYNRRGFLTCADQQLRIARRQGKDALVMYIDMNGFKQLNDNFGHSTGDRALSEIGHMLQNTIRDCDVVARIGGDEFTILALDANGHGARAIQNRIEKNLAALNARGGFPIPLSLTVGFTRVRPSDTAGIPELLDRADRLLYHRKRRRKLLESHSAEMTTASSSSRPVSKALRSKVHHECAVSASCSSSPSSNSLRHQGR